MSHHFEAIITQFEQFLQELITLVETWPANKWQAIVENEQRPVNVLFHHLGGGMPFAVHLAMQLATQNTLPAMGMSDIDRLNAEHAAEYVNATQAEVLALLRHNLAEIPPQLRSLTSEQLNKKAPFMLFGGQEFTTQEILTMLLLGHGQGHLANIRQVL